MRVDVMAAIIGAASMGDGSQRQNSLTGAAIRPLSPQVPRPCLSFRPYSLGSIPNSCTLRVKVLRPMPSNVAASMRFPTRVLEGLGDERGFEDAIQFVVHVGVTARQCGLHFAFQCTAPIGRCRGRASRWNSMERRRECRPASRRLPRPALAPSR